MAEVHPFHSPTTGVEEDLAFIGEIAHQRRIYSMNSPMQQRREVVVLDLPLEEWFQAGKTRYKVGRLARSTDGA